MDQLLRELGHLGLSEKEALVYVATLQLGPSTAQEIATLAGVNRATTYVMIESLEQQGLMASITEEKKRLFVAESPDRLMAILHLQKQELSEKERELAEVMPKLHALFNSSKEKPDIRYIEGLEGIEQLRREFESLSGEIIQIIGYDALVELVDFDTTMKHRKQLKTTGTKLRSLCVTKQAKDQVMSQVWDEVGCRVIHPDQFPYPVSGEITVRGNHVLMFTYTKKPIAVSVHSNELANTLRALFEIAWGSREKD